MSNSSLKDIKLKVSPIWYLKEFSQLGIGKLIHKMPIVGKGLRFFGHRLVVLGNLGEREAKRQKYLQMENDPLPQQFGSSYGYADEVVELVTAYDYHQQIKNGHFKNSESGLLYGHLVKMLSDVLSADKGITTFLNFGVSYAHIDSLLAKSFPKVNFTGIDRSSFTKLYNEYAFPKLNNMEFIAGDIFELLKKRRFDNGVFFHTRTLCLLSQGFIEKLYKSVAEAGFKYIIGAEQTGMSRETFKPYEFSEETKPSVLFRDKMFIHNYPGILKSAGFSLTEIELLKTGHPDEDLRVLSFVGRKA